MVLPPTGMEPSIHVRPDGTDFFRCGRGMNQHVMFPDNDYQIPNYNYVLESEFDAHAIPPGRLWCGSSFRGSEGCVTVADYDTQGGNG